jgi:hypothetical protein
MMARRNSPNDISDLGELSQLSDFVFDKRQGHRASAKRHRRNRHYERQFIRNALAHLPRVEQAGADGQPRPLAPDPGLRQEDES